MRKIKKAGSCSCRAVPGFLYMGGARMKVWVLMENTSLSPDFCSEHGLSLWIESGNCRLLFDTGQSEKFARNAGQLGVDLAEADLAVLSHGHYDHGGGLKKFLVENEKAPVYLSCHAFEKHFSGRERDIGLDPALQACGRLVYVREKKELGGGMVLYPSGGFRPVYPVDASGLTTFRDGRWMKEDFRHELYLLIREGGRRILFSGCSHAGILNIMEWLRPDILVGGFHLKHLDPDGAGKAVLEQMAEKLKTYDTVYYTCHCTGTAQYAYLKEKMGDRLHYLAAGEHLTL